MSGINFFTPVVYGNQPKSTSKAVLEAADHYFYLGGKRACIIAGRVEHGKEGVLLSSGSSSFLLSALKVASYFTIIIPLLILIVKAVLRYNHQFHLIDPKSELERNVDIAPNIVAKLQQLMPVIESRQDNAQIEWLSKRHTGVFRLTEAPHLVFKIHTDEDVGVVRNNSIMNGEEQIRGRFESMIKGKEVCLAHQLDSLIVPQARLFELEVGGRIYPVIAEQSLNVRATESAQEELYWNHADSLERAVRQLGTFIAETGFSDVIWQNIPVVEDAAELQGSRCIGLIDLEHMEGAKAGILGSGNGSSGLVRRLFSEAQIDAVLNDARERGVISQREAQEAKDRRLEEIQAHNQLQQFYARNGLLENARKPIQVDDLASLGLDLTERAERAPLSALEQILAKLHANGTDGGVIEPEEVPQVTLREAIVNVIAALNEKIQSAPHNEAPRGARYVLLNTNHGDLRDYLHTLRGGRRIEYIPSPEQESETWMAQIINALVAKGHLFKLDKVNGHGYFIQA